MTNLNQITAIINSIRINYASKVGNRRTALVITLAAALLAISGSITAQINTTDRVLVIVNDDVITQSEFSYRRASVVGDIKASGREIPEQLDEQLLETMVSERMQVQEALRRGIEVADQELVVALERFAQQQNMTLAQLKVSVEQSGQPFSVFTASVRDSITISRLSDFYARARVTVPDYEIDGWLTANNLDKDDIEYELAQILIKGGDEKTDKAELARDEIARGLSFQDAVLTYSEALDAESGGVIGWRKPEQLPSLFVDAVKDLQVGGVSEVVRSPNGHHILKLLNIKGDRSEILQANVRHILISATSRVGKSQAIKKASDLRNRIVNGEDFDALARIYSDDSGSAALGGELGWVSPGQMVPEFEKMYTEMPIGEVSVPFQSQYGVHILRVDDRRQKNVTDQIKRVRAENVLRRQRADREFGQWVLELMEGAYIKHVAKPA